MKPGHEQAARVALSAVRDRGFALAGGNALSAHGIGTRESNDIDLFTNRMDENVGESAERLRAAFEQAGYSATIQHQDPMHAGLQTGQPRLGQTQAASTNSEAARRHSPHEHSRTTEDRTR